MNITVLSQSATVGGLAAPGHARPRQTVRTVFVVMG